MRLYETMYILKADLEEEQLNALVDRFSKVIEGQGGTIQEVNRWGKRKLAYEINKLREGYYLLVKFIGGPEVSKELERVFKITDDVIRYMILRLDDAIVPETVSEDTVTEDQVG